MINIQEQSMSPDLLSINELEYQYRSTGFCLKNINFSISQGDFLVLTGPNGSGKTTLVKALLGLVKPVHGVITYKQNPIKKPVELLRHIGFVMQNPDDQIFFPEVYEDIAFGPRNLGLSPKTVDERVQASLEVLGITHLRHRTFTSLSFGEKKKVSLAGVLAMEPELLILDEPTLGLDPWSKHSFIQTLFSLLPRQTLLIITHDFALMQRATKILYMNNGIIEQEYSSYESFKNERFADIIPC